MDAMVVAREGQWRNTKKMKRTTTTDGVGVVIRPFQSSCVLVCVCVCVLVWLVAFVAVITAHPRWPRFPFWLSFPLFDLFDAGVTMRSDAWMRKNDNHLASDWAHHTPQRALPTVRFDNSAIGTVFQNVYRGNAHTNTLMVGKLPIM